MLPILRCSRCALCCDVITCAVLHAVCCVQVLDGLLLRALPAVLFALPFYFLMGLNAAVLQVRTGVVTAAQSAAQSAAQL